MFLNDRTLYRWMNQNSTKNSSEIILMFLLNISHLRRNPIKLFPQISVTSVLLSEAVLILLKFEILSSEKDSRKKWGDSDLFWWAIPLKIIPALLQRAYSSHSPSFGRERGQDSALRNRFQYKSSSSSLQAN